MQPAIIGPVRRVVHTFELVRAPSTHVRAPGFASPLIRDKRLCYKGARPGVQKLMFAKVAVA